MFDAVSRAAADLSRSMHKCLNGLMPFNNPEASTNSSNRTIENRNHPA
jgi:hypothetical protein